MFKRKWKGQTIILARVDEDDYLTKKAWQSKTLIINSIIPLSFLIEEIRYFSIQNLEFVITVCCLANIALRFLTKERIVFKKHGGLDGTGD